MSKLNTRKSELETLRNQWREHAAAHPTDTRNADALRSIESELATVNAQIVYGPGAPAMIGQAIGRAAIAQHAPRSSSASRADVPTPNPLPAATAPAEPQRSFTAPTDVPWPQPDRNAAAEHAKQNGRAPQHSPQPQQSPTVPTAATAPAATPTAEQTAEPRRPFTAPTDVPWPQTNGR